MRLYQYGGLIAATVVSAAFCVTAANAKPPSPPSAPSTYAYASKVGVNVQAVNTAPSQAVSIGSGNFGGSITSNIGANASITVVGGGGPR